MPIFCPYNFRRASNETRIEEAVKKHAYLRIQLSEVRRAHGGHAEDFRQAADAPREVRRAPRQGVAAHGLSVQRLRLVRDRLRGEEVGRERGREGSEGDERSEGSEGDK